VKVKEEQEQDDGEVKEGQVTANVKEGEQEADK